MAVLSNRAVISVLAFILVIAFAFGAGCVEGEGEGEGDNARFTYVEEFAEDLLSGELIGGGESVTGNVDETVTGNVDESVTGNVDKSVKSVSGPYYQERGREDPPWVIVFEPEGSCELYNYINGEWEGNLYGILRYAEENGNVFIMPPGGQEYDQVFLYTLEIKDGGATLSDDENTFVRL